MIQLDRDSLLALLRDKYWDKIDSFVENQVMEAEPQDLYPIFEVPVDYAFLGSIEEMKVSDFETTMVDEDEQTVTGMIELVLCVDGYAHWDGEDVLVDSSVMDMELSFSLVIDGEKYLDFELEYVY